MSFRCQKCKKPQGVSPIKVVTETRRVTYPVAKDSNGRDYIPEGWEIVKELDLCEKCANQYRR